MISLEAEAPKFRLGDATRPTRYRLELTIVPDAPAFSGTMDIELELRAASSETWVNGHELKIREATLNAGSDQLSGRIMTEGKNLTGFAFGRSVQPGSARLHITFEGKFKDKSSAGLFKMKEQGDWY